MSEWPGEWETGDFRSGREGRVGYRAYPRLDMRDDWLPPPIAVESADNFGLVEHDGRWWVTAINSGGVQGRTVCVCADYGDALAVINALLDKYAPDKIVGAP